MRLINISVGYYIAINNQGQFAYSIVRRTDSNWIVRQVDKFGNQGMIVGAYRTIEEAKASINA